MVDPGARITVWRPNKNFCLTRPAQAPRASLLTYSKPWKGELARVWEALGGSGRAWECLGDAFLLVFESLKRNHENLENVENVENLLDPACSSSQSQPAHLARDAPSLPAWVEEVSSPSEKGGGLL